MSEIPERIDSKYRYVLLAALRAEQMTQGASPKKEDPVGKPVRVAMREISDGDVEWDYGPAEEPEPEVDDEAADEAEAAGEDSTES